MSTKTAKASIVSTSSGTGLTPYLGWSLWLHGMGLLLGISLAWQDAFAGRTPPQVSIEDSFEEEAWNDLEEVLPDEEVPPPDPLEEEPLEDPELPEDEPLEEKEKPKPEELIIEPEEPLREAETLRPDDPLWLTRIRPMQPQPQPQQVSVQVIVPPSPIIERNKPPRYPEQAIRLGIHGSVLLTVTVRADGRVADCVVSRSSGSRLLDEAALRAVRGWKFRNGPGTVQVPVHFILRGHR